MSFKNLLSKLEQYEKDPSLIRTKDGAVGFFCADCDFYKDSDKDLECGAYKLLVRLIEKDVISLRHISDALRD